MTKIILLTDTHFGVRGDAKIFLDFQERFFKEVFFPYVDEHKIDTIVHLGDTFDRRKFINYYTLFKTRTMYFDELKSRGLKCYTLIGNHDTFYKDSNHINSIELVIKDYHYENTIIPIVSDVKELFLGDRKVLLVPWICKENQDRVMLSIRETNAEVCFGHFAINGFIMHHGAIEEKGLEQNLFSKFNLVASGHFHFKSNYDHIHYLGCPYEMTWGDFGTTKGFHVFDTETLGLEFIENPYRMFHKIYYTENMVLPQSDLYSGVYVKVIVKNRKKSKKFDWFLEELYERNPFDIKIIDEITVTDDPQIVVDASEVDDPPKTINRYIDSLDLPFNIEKEKLKKLMYEGYVRTFEI